MTQNSSINSVNRNNTKSSAETGTVKSRLLELLRAKRMSQSELARELGVSATYVGAMRKSLSNARLHRLMEIFPDLNRDWLLYGEGQMLTDSAEEAIQAPSDRIVPLLPVEAFAGRLQDWSRGICLADCEKTFSPYPGTDMAMRVSGDSMEPKFHNGSIIFIKRINQKAFIPWGSPMVLDTENGALIKAVYPVKNQPGEEEEYIEARSYNPDYPSIFIPTTSIYALFRILGQAESYTTL